MLTTERMPDNMTKNIKPDGILDALNRQKDSPLEQKINTELVLKWGDVIKGEGGGWTAVPNFLLKKQGELGLKPLELNVLINLIRFWWVPEIAPFPSLEKIAQEVGVSERTIYRTISSLEENGFIKRINEAGKTTQYELNGLVEKLKQSKMRCSSRG